MITFNYEMLGCVVIPNSFRDLVGMLKQVQHDRIGSFSNLRIFMKYLVAILLPENIAREISIVQRKYKNERWNISLPPHITLVPPADAIMPVKKISQIIKDTIANTKKFVVELTKINHFKNKYHVIYQGVKISPKLIDLHSSLSKNCEYFHDRIFIYNDFVPHVTLSNDLNEEEFKEKYPMIEEEIIEKKIIGKSFNCEQIALLSRKPDDEDKWQIEKTFDLK